jgi:hypothetical protein
MDTTLQQECGSTDSGGVHLPQGARIIAIAVVLWVASNIAVGEIAKFAAWEGTGTYRGVADLCKWDCNWYGSVIEPGYLAGGVTSVGEANWVFPPLFPFTAYPLHQWLRLSLPLSLVLASKLGLLLAIYAFMLMFADELQTTADYWRAGLLVAFNPYIVYAHAGYAEPLYFALTALGFYFARRRRWLLAGAAGALSSATRVVGAVFGASYVVSWLKAEGWRVPWRKLDLNVILGLLLCPLGTVLFMLYLQRHIGDALALQHGHVAWGRELRNPFQTLWNCLQQPHWSRLWAEMMIVAWLATGWLFVLRKPELGVYLAAALLLAFLSPIVGYWGVARYIWWQPPFLYAIYRILRRSELAWTIYLAFASGMAAFMVVQWFSGHNFVV